MLFLCSVEGNFERKTLKKYQKFSCKTETHSYDNYKLMCNLNKSNAIIANLELLIFK